MWRFQIGAMRASLSWHKNHRYLSLEYFRCYPTLQGSALLYTYSSPNSLIPCSTILIFTCLHFFGVFKEWINTVVFYDRRWTILLGKKEMSQWCHQYSMYGAKLDGCVVHGVIDYIISGLCRSEAIWLYVWWVALSMRLSLVHVKEELLYNCENSVAVYCADFQILIFLVITGFYTSESDVFNGIISLFI